MTIIPLQNIIPIGTEMNANFTSIPMQTSTIVGAAIQIFFATPLAGTDPTGTFSLQVSNDPAIPPFQQGALPTNWTAVANSSQSISAPGNVYWDEGTIEGTWIQVVYVDGSSGASTATITVAQATLKGV